MANKKDIFVCPGICKECEHKKICPFEGQYKKSDKLEQIITPEWIIKRFNINLFDVIQLGEIVSDGMFEKEEAEKSVESKIKNSLNSELSKLYKSPQLVEVHDFTKKEIDFISREACNFIEEKIYLIVEIMVKKILKACNGNCLDENCESCWMREYCPQIETIKS